MAIAHDDWLEGLGVDLAQLRPAGSGASPPGVSNPTLAGDDPELQGALVETTVEFGKGFIKGVGDTAGGIVNSPEGQFAGGLINPVGPLAARAVDAAITGDPDKLAPPDPFAGITNFDPEDPTQQKRAEASVQSTADLGLALLGIKDPIAMAENSAEVLVNGDPNEVGQGAGKVFVAIVPAVVAGGLAGLAEGGAVEAGAAEGGTAEAGSARPPVRPLVGEQPQPVSSLDPALGEPFDPIPPSEPPPSSAGFRPNDGPFGGNGPSAPETPRVLFAPESGELPGPANDPSPPSLPPDPVPPPPFDPSLFPDFDIPSPPPDPIPGGPPGFPFGVDQILPE